jgi:hypothetical protein
MITTAGGLELALEQLGHTYKAMAALRAENGRASKSWLAVMAEGWIDQAHQLQREIEEYTWAAALEESQAELWLAVKGRGIGDGVGPASVLTALLDAFRKGVQAVAEFLYAGQLARRPTAALKQMCDWQVVALHPGSLKVGLRLPDSPAQLALWEGNAPNVREAVREFLTVAAWAAADEDPKALAGRFPDAKRRRLQLNVVKPFVPRPRGSVESVTVSGRGAPFAVPIILTRAASQRIDTAIDQTTTDRIEDHTGDLREIDLDNLSMTIRNAPDVRQVRCTFDESLLETAMEALDRPVKVSGIRQTGPGRRVSPTLHVFRLEVIDESVPQPGAVVPD